MAYMAFGLGSGNAGSSRRMFSDRCLFKATRENPPKAPRPRRRLNMGALIIRTGFWGPQLCWERRLHMMRSGLQLGCRELPNPAWGLKPV